MPGIFFSSQTAIKIISTEVYNGLGGMALDGTTDAAYGKINLCK